MHLLESPAFIRPAKFVRVLNGDLWQLGKHRLACGDAADPIIVNRLLGKERPRIMVTDPPYGVDYDPQWRATELKHGRTVAGGKLLNDDRADWREAWKLFPGDIAYVWHAGRNATAVDISLQAADFPVRSQIVWDKCRLIISRGHYHWQHEACWYAVRKLKTVNWQGGRKQTTVWPIRHRRSATGHGTEKPLDCMRRPILNHTLQGDAVYEPFLGSGTTMIAAEMTGRRCFAIELSPEYCGLSIARWEQLAGAKARLVSRAA
jgi:DNA modification methylase